jgi:thiol:disulfide interchange protein DsbD
MEFLKQLTSVPLFLTVVWLIWVYGRLSGAAPGDSADHIARLLVGLVVLAIAGWILRQWPARRRGYAAASFARHRRLGRSLELWTHGSSAMATFF